MDDTPLDKGQQRTLLFLKVLVFSLTLTMIVGLIVLIGLIVMRLSAEASAPLPDQITLPDGVTATAFTRGPDWLAVVTADDRILIYNPEGTVLRQEIVVTTGN